MVMADDQQAEQRPPDAAAPANASLRVQEPSGASFAPASADRTPGPTRGQRARELGVCPAVGHCVLRADNVVKRFHHGLPPRRRTVEVLRGASLMVCEGELVGLVGENGSGKSTLMQILVGLLGRDGGSVSQEPGRFGYCPQQPMVWGKLTVDEHFELFARAYGLDDEARDRAVGGLLVELEFERYRAYRVEELSGGTRQKLNLALALMHDPSVLLLDEPYSGFDWETYVRFWDMAERRRDQGMGILIVSHMLTERERLDRVYELRDGRAVEG
jgi:ABC-type multidrug transport system ATPase subunit